MFSTKRQNTQHTAMFLLALASDTLKDANLPLELTRLEKRAGERHLRIHSINNGQKWILLEMVQAGDHCEKPEHHLECMAV